MSSTNVDERMMMKAMSSVTSAPSSDRLMTGIFMGIMDAWDRKIEREKFIELLQQSLMYNEILARLHLSNGWLKVYYSDTPPPEDTLANSIKEITVEGEKCRERLVKQLELLVQCPDDEDTTH